jgi:hypothetical protein
VHRLYCLSRSNNRPKKTQQIHRYFDLSTLFLSPSLEKVTPKKKPHTNANTKNSHLKRTPSLAALLSSAQKTSILPKKNHHLLTVGRKKRQKKKKRKNPSSSLSFTLLFPTTQTYTNAPE